MRISRRALHNIRRRVAPVTRRIARARYSKHLVIQAVGYIALGIRLARLGATRPASTKIFLVCATVLVKEAVPQWAPRWISLRLRYEDQAFTCSISSRGDLEAMHGVLWKGEYGLRLTEAPNVIIDLGSHVGFSILVWKTHYPRAKVYGFEADPQTFAKLKANVASLPDVVVEPVAVAPVEGRTIFYRSEANWASSLLRPKQKAEAVTVTATTLDQIVQRRALGRIELLKIDIEGAEFDVLQSCRTLQLVECVVGEFHGDISGQPIGRFMALLAGFEIDVQETGRGRYQFRAFRTRAPGAQGQEGNLAARPRSELEG